MTELSDKAGSILRSWRVEALPNNIDPDPFNVPKVMDYIDEYPNGVILPSNLYVELGKVIIVRDMTEQDFFTFIEGLKIRCPSGLEIKDIP